MRLNANGQSAGGRSTVHVDGALVPAFAGRVAGSPSGNWFAGQVLCQLEHEGVWRLASAYPQAATYTVQAQHGQNRLMSNARIWVCDLDGYIDSLGSRQAHIAPVALDDLTDQVAVAVKDTNALAIVDARTGVFTEIEETGPDSWQEADLHFVGGELWYRKHGRIKAWPHTVNVPVIPARGVRYCDGFLLEWQEGRGVILRPEDSTHGIVVIPAPEDAFGLDLAFLPNGLIRVVSSTGPAELPHEFRRRDVDTNAWTVNGEQADLINLLLPASAPQPTPAPQPEPPAPSTPEPFMPPDHSHIVRAVDATYPHLLQTNTRDTCREFLWRSVEALAKADPKWGFLSKSAGENHVVINGQMVSIDAVTYRDWDGVVDIIANNSNPPERGHVSWGLAEKRPSNVWVQAVPFSEGTAPVPAPDPPSDPPATDTPPSGGIADAELVKAFEAFTAAAQLLPELVRQTVRDELRATAFRAEIKTERLPLLGVVTGAVVLKAVE